jgi:hypothetical protein
MKINLSNFKKVIKKATLNGSIDNLQLKFENGRIKSQMVSNTRSAVTIINVENDVFDSNKNFTLNFFIIEYTLSFINAFDQDECEAEITDDYEMIIKYGNQIERLQLFDENPIKQNILKKEPDDLKYFLALNFDDDLKLVFQKLISIGKKYKQSMHPHVLLENNIFSLNLADCKNSKSNFIKFELKELKNSGFDNFKLCFDFDPFKNLYEVIKMEKNIELKFVYDEEINRGFLSAQSDDMSERYFLRNRTL